MPANRAAVVEEVRLAQERRKVFALTRARMLGLPARVTLPDNRGVWELMGWDGDKPLYYATLNANAAISTGSSLIRVAPYNAQGFGGTVGVWDGGSVRATHQEFGGRVTIMDGAANNYHATHVGGTIGATGVVADARGMAPHVRIDSYDWNSDLSEMTSRGATVSGEAGKIYVSNHSYGYLSGWVSTGGSSPAYEWYGSGTTAAGYEDDFGRYNTYARDLDSLAYSTPYYAIFWAAGNDRSDNPATGAHVTLSPGGTVVTYDPELHPPGDGVYRSGYENISFNGLAKNVITIGAVDDAVTSGTRDPAKAVMTTFSCWGPADDGRIKPDLVANGYRLYSTYTGSDTAYATMSGTSMATPNAAGAAQQLVSYYSALFSGHYMRASTLKGLLIHTADDIGTPGPDYRNGWGLINAKAAADLIAAVVTSPAVPRLIEQQLTSSVVTRTHAFTWDGVSPIRVTLCWSDPAGAATATHDLRTPQLVNDLNLRVVGPTGTQHFPYVMPFVGTWAVASMSSAATAGTNNTDNVEQVYITTPPAPGDYQAVVTYSGTLATTQQHYSLLISGAAPSAPSPQAVTPDSAETGSVALTIIGQSFAADATVAFFRAGESDVSASVSSVTPTSITCTLDVTSLAKGLWSVRVTNPDGKSGALPAAFVVISTLFEQDFDPSAPGWSASATDGSTYWSLTTAQSHTAPNAYFARGPKSVNLDNLQSESIPISAMAQGLRLHVWHKYAFDTNGDGGVLEISSDNGATWKDVLAEGSGAVFQQGGYTGAIAFNSQNPLKNRSVWTGTESVFAEVIVALDAATYAGKTLRARWRLGTDNKTASDGWYVDSVRITGYSTANTSPVIVTPAAAVPAVLMGTVTALSVAAEDNAGEAALTYTWSVNDTPEHPVAFSVNGSNAAKQTTATFSAPRTYAFVVTVRDSEGLAATSGVAVAVQATPDSVVVAPASAEVEAGTTQAFDAVAHDQFGLPLERQPLFAWRVSGGGVIDTNGLFTAGVVAGGPHTVTAEAEGLSGTAQVTVLPPPVLYWVLGVVASPATGGSVTGAGLYEAGTQAPIAAAPAADWRFKGWQGVGIADTNALETTVLMDADKEVSASFERRPLSRTTVLIIR